jgi:putative transposase
MSTSSYIIVFIHRPEYDELMKRLQAFKFELTPNGEQLRDMRRYAGSCRFVYNRGLVLQKENYEAGNTFIGYVVPLNSFKRHQFRLARYQRQMSSKEQFSNNWKKAKSKVQRIHIDIANARKDFLHKTTHAISKNHALVCIEDLQIRNMSKSSKGTSEKHGKMVKQKSGLNRAILDQGWGEFRRQLDYKMAWNGGILLAVPPHNSSRICPMCTHVSKDNRLTQAKFLCVNCGYENNADLVGAINILKRGHRLLACGELAQSGLSAKQEPIEVTQALHA